MATQTYAEPKYSKSDLDAAVQAALEKVMGPKITSKPAPTAHEDKPLTVEIGDGRSTVGVFAVTHRDFKTGSRGYFGVGKVTIGGKKYQCQTQMVEIGSKPK